MAMDSTSTRLAAEDGERAWLLRTLAEAQAKARQLGRPVWLRLHGTWPEMGDPWGFLVGSERSLGFAQDRPWVAWHDGATGLTVAASGEATVLSARGRERFAALQDQCSRLVEQTVERGWGSGGEVELDLPLALGGFSFTPEGSQGVWQGWPAARFCVPERLIYRYRGRCGWVLTSQVPARASLARLADRIARERAGLWLPSEADPTEGPLAIVATPGEKPRAWSARVEAARRAVAAGELDKVVLAREVHLAAATGQPLSATHTLALLRAQQKDAVVFGFGPLGEPAFVGATPEPLVRVKGRQISSVALAGTAPRGSDPSADRTLGERLLLSSKDLIEHRAVVEAVRSALRPACEQLVFRGPQLRRLPHVQHLETRFWGTLHIPGGVLSSVEQLHPTPAVGGWPQTRARRWLEQNETLERGWYGAPVGWVSPSGDGVFAVAIRSGLVWPDSALAYVGAGIVAASEGAAEWRETELKLRAFAGALAGETKSQTANERRPHPERRSPSEWATEGAR